LLVVFRIKRQPQKKIDRYQIVSSVSTLESSSLDKTGYNMTLLSMSINKTT